MHFWSFDSIRFLSKTNPSAAVYFSITLAILIYGLSAWKYRIESADTIRPILKDAGLTVVFGVLAWVAFTTDSYRQTLRESNDIVASETVGLDRASWRRRQPSAEHNERRSSFTPTQVHARCCNPVAAVWLGYHLLLPENSQ